MSFLLGIEIVSARESPASARLLAVSGRGEGFYPELVNIDALLRCPSAHNDELARARRHHQNISSPRLALVLSLANTLSCAHRGALGRQGRRCRQVGLQ